MKIIIPLAGSGQRFIKQCYQQIKPLIKINNKPMIAHVIEMFPGENDFVFICREEHLKKTALKKILKKLKPKAEIISIKGHKKGPVYSLLSYLDTLKANEQVLVSYCDFSMNWNYKQFKSTILKNNCDGAVITYTGFHPHLLGNDLYAGCKVNNKSFLTAIKEKYSYTKNKMASHHSAGAYYFQKGSTLKKYARRLIELKMHNNNEYYVSMLYHLMLKDKLKTYVQTVDHFCQWGTPEDLEEYLYWQKIFSKEKPC